MLKSNERIAIVNGFRTPFLKVGTMFRGIDADELGVYPLKESFLRSNVSPKDIDEVIGVLWTASTCGQCWSSYCASFWNTKRSACNNGSS